MIGLKKFINDFSNIKNSSLDNIKLFEEYVIYAIIFNFKGQLNEETKQLYKKLTEIKKN